jgi:hypothetical protein
VGQLAVVSDLDLKALTDRARVVQSYIDEERKRVLDLIDAPDGRFKVIDDREFLIYCIEHSWTAAEVPRARELFDQVEDRFIPEPEIDQGIEDLM